MSPTIKKLRIVFNRNLTFIINFYCINHEVINKKCNLEIPVLVHFLITPSIPAFIL
jgi:hypothetical protein